jgi:hypothetical protein
MTRSVAGSSAPTTPTSDLTARLRDAFRLDRAGLARFVLQAGLVAAVVDTPDTAHLSYDRLRDLQESIDDAVGLRRAFEQGFPDQLLDRIPELEVHVVAAS